MPASSTQYSQSPATENFLQLQDRGMQQERGAKRDQQGHIAGASQGYDEANPTLQGGSKNGTSAGVAVARSDNFSVVRGSRFVRWKLPLIHSLLRAVCENICYNELVNP